MKTMKNWLLTGLLFMIVSTAFSQNKITGTITDGALSLPGANAAVKGSSDAGSSDFDGKFTITTSATSGQIVVSYLGYESKTVSFTVVTGGTINLGVITLSSNSNELSEIVVKSSTVDIAKDRKTPVAVSTIRAAEIQEKLGSQEFPEILKNTPSVYTTKSGGGFGDSRISIRGFDQKNIAVMINGMPVNDMEGGTVYWSNWAGLSDVTSAMQVQRGLGSSKLAIASVGGTINILTKASDLKEGGSVATSFGNDNYMKSQVSYSTGKLSSGFSASLLYSHTQGDGYVDGTKFNGDNYYIGLGYATKDNKHDFQFTFTGAPQWHNQRTTNITLETYQKYGTPSDPNIKYNSDWGYLNGKEFNLRRNYYHKPVASINWDYTINETTKLSTIAYASFGRGGGTNGAGGIQGNNYANARLRTADGLVDYDKIVAYNSGQPITLAGATAPITRTRNAAGQFQNTSSSAGTGAGISQISSINSHNWYGAIINLDKKLGQYFTLDAGIDVRGYKGLHYQNINNLLGADNYFDNFDINNPNRVLTQTNSVYPSWNPFKSTSGEEKINFNNDGDVRWYGAFTQLEYSNDKLTAFIQGAISQQGFKRVDYFKYLSSDPLSSTDYENILGGNVKGGANYNINEHHNVFVNAGYYSKQPFFNAVYAGNVSVVNPLLTNEKILGLEAGYGFRSGIFNANVNVYRTSWKDRNLRISDSRTTNTGGYFDYTGITEVHSGFEIEGSARVMDKLKINAMFSLGDWEYEGEANANTYDNQNNIIESALLYLDKVKVGDAAQLTASLGATYEVLTRLNVDATYNYNEKLYAFLNPNSFTSADNKGALELPAYGLVDAGISYKWLVGRTKANSVNFRLNVNNLFDTVYIAESKTNNFASDNLPVTGTALPGSNGTYASNGLVYRGIATNNAVFFGFGRTWNFSLRYDF